MASIEMLVGGALVNAVAFSGSNYLFSMLRDTGTLDEQKRHKQLQTAQADWSRQRTERLDWINEELRRQGHAMATFRDVDAAIRGYSMVNSNSLSLSSPTDDQKDREIVFIVLGIVATGLVAWKLAK
jgi:hypothetical protein